MGRHSMVEEPPPRPPDGRISTGPQRAVGVSTGEHRTTGAPTGRHPVVGYPTDQRRALTSTGQQRAITTGQQRAITTGQRRVEEGGFATEQRAIATTGRQRAITTTGQQRAITTTGEQRAVTATGHHRAIGKAAARRRIAKWPFVVVAVVVLIVLGLVGWSWANNVVDNRAEAQAQNCAEGDSTMKVVVAPGAEQAVSAAATKWNNARTVVHAHCVHINVQPVPSDRVFAALTGSAGLDSIGGLPAAWIPEATDWASRLATARPDLVSSPAEPLTGAYTYVFLGGGTNLDEVAVRAAQVFRDFLLAPEQAAGLTGTGRP